MNRQQTDLLEALPPVVTGVDVDNAFESWQRSSLLRKGSTRSGEGGHNSSIGCLGNSDQEGGWYAAEDTPDGDRDALAGSAQITAAAEPVLEARVPAVTVDLEGGMSNENVETLSSGEEKDATAFGQAAAPLSTLGVGTEETHSDGALEMPTAARLPNVEDGGATEAMDAGGTIGSLEAYEPPSGVGLARLCRRAVILLTRSPNCPDLVAWQAHPAEQRTYEQMEPLLARANMTHKDLHPTLVGCPQMLSRSLVVVGVVTGVGSERNATTLLTAVGCL